MKQTMLLKLAPSPEQHAALLETMHAFNDACNVIAETAFAEQLGNKFKLQKLVYADVRKRFKLSSQLAIRAISKTADAYKRDKSIKPTFRHEGAITYDERVMSFKGLHEVSLLTLQGRVLVPFRIGGYQEARLSAIKGQADLIYRQGALYLAVTLDVPTPAPDEVTDTLGVDLGIINLATDSEGEAFSGEQVERVRTRHHALRQHLQKRATKSAKRHLKKLSGKEARFRKNTNHVISKRIIHKAKAKKQGIAIEELRQGHIPNDNDASASTANAVSHSDRHLRSRTEARLRHAQRARHSSWSFGQLRFFLSYKAALAGIPLHTVDPRNTSRTCRACGYCAKANRKRQAVFLCQACGHSENADRNAAINISRASVMVPIVSLGSSSAWNQMDA